jgi:hypothetical protein
LLLLLTEFEWENLISYSKVFFSKSDVHYMEDLDFIVETVFGHESEAERKSYREKMLFDENPRWIKEFARRLRRLDMERDRGKE